MATSSVGLPERQHAVTVAVSLRPDGVNLLAEVDGAASIVAAVHRQFAFNGSRLTGIDSHARSYSRCSERAGANKPTSGWLSRQVAICSSSRWRLIAMLATSDVADASSIFRAVLS